MTKIRVKLEDAIIEVDKNELISQRNCQIDLFSALIRKFSPELSLARKSPYCKALLDGAFRESGDQVVQFSSVKSKVLKRALSFHQSSETVPDERDFLQFVDKYLFVDAFDLCIERLIAKLRSEKLHSFESLELFAGKGSKDYFQ